MKKEISRTTDDIDGDDVLNTKKELNNMGYYKVDEKVGMNKFTDEGLFKGINSFQKDNKLKVDEVIKPGGETEKKINEVRKNNAIVSKEKPYKENVKDWYDEVKRVNALKGVSDVNKHQYISCLPAKGDGKMKFTGAFAALGKEALDLGRKNITPKKYGGRRNIYIDSIKDMSNNAKGAMYGHKKDTNCLDLLKKPID
ncbi:MAG: hypothetical protein ACK5N8_05430 [Alphaproteobacteria bacterium]